MANKRKYISTEYGMINLRDGDQSIHLDPEFLAELYWDLQDGKIAEVVWCKDCKFWHTEGQYCDRFGVMWKEFYTSPNDYCAWGERKEDAKID